jgi:hypothetical protein
LPPLAPLLVIVGGTVLAAVTRWIHLPVHDASFGQAEAGLNRGANEDDSAFGPIGSMVVLGVPLIGAWGALEHRIDQRRLALAIAVPSFLILFSLYAVYEPWATRYLIVPVALSAPLFGWFFATRSLSIGVIAVAALAVALTLAYDWKKPLSSRPWQLTWAQALNLRNGNLSGVLAAYDRFVPAHACVGTVLQPEEPSYLLYGRNLTHRVFDLPVADDLQAAVHDRLSYVVISQAPVLGYPATQVFANAGWKVEELGKYWLLVIAPGADGASGC